MDKKINDVNEMIEHNRTYEHVEEEEDDERVKNNRSPTSDVKKNSLNNSRENDDECNETNRLEASDISDRCNSGNVNNRIITEELSQKDKEVRTKILKIYTSSFKDFFSLVKFKEKNNL
jgi:hypothetical protein